MVELPCALRSRIFGTIESFRYPYVTFLACNIDERLFNLVMGYRTTVVVFLTVAGSENVVKVETDSYFGGRLKLVSLCHTKCPHCSIFGAAVETHLSAYTENSVHPLLQVSLPFCLILLFLTRSILIRSTFICPPTFTKLFFSRGE